MLRFWTVSFAGSVNVMCSSKGLLCGVVLQIQGGVQEKSFLRNKAAQILSLVFVSDYPGRWASFLSDMLQLLPLGEGAVDMYLRTLMAIDSEVVDREIGHTPQVQGQLSGPKNFKL